MNGILIIDKPAGLTSHDVVARVRRVLKTKRVGHTGTLDPFATGVLVLLVGNATRLARFLDKDAKEYEAGIKFGSETDTGDITGIEKENSNLGISEIEEKLANADWAALLAGFRGEIEQTPPMFSAKKVKGKKLYEFAREGVEIERKPVRVTIFDIDIDVAQSGQATDEALLKVTCSAGTYIRTLGEDIGRKLGVGAHLIQLRRLRAGRFDAASSISLDEFTALAEPASALLPIEAAVEHLPSIILSAERVAATRNGLGTAAAENSFPAGEPVRIMDEYSKLVAIGEYSPEERSVRPTLVLA
jgi:tRNA pseudouridine55 synthase